MAVRVPSNFLRSFQRMLKRAKHGQQVSSVPWGTMDMAQMFLRRQVRRQRYHFSQWVGERSLHQVLKKRRKQRARFEAAIGISYLIMSARSWSPFLSLASASSAITSYSCAISRRFRLPSSPMKMAAEARHPTASDRSHLIRFKISWLPRGISSDVSHDREKNEKGIFVAYSTPAPTRCLAARG